MKRCLNSVNKLQRIFITVLAALVTVNVEAQVPLSFEVENRGADCSVSSGGLINNMNLPDPFSFHNGNRVVDFQDWSCRRNEIKADIEAYEIGTKPEAPNDITADYSNGTLTVTVSENGRTLTLTSAFNIPSGNGPHPIVIGMNSGTGTLSANLFNGIAQVPFNHDQVATYSTNGGKDLSAPFYTFYPNLTGVGDYAAWSWGISRLIDGLELVADEINLDMGRIAVTGCSYAGKMALIAGAFDERITLTIAQESGGGGINSWRTSQDFVNRTGTNIEKIDNTNGSWFMQSMLSLDPYSLPHDHHELIAMIAPRAFLALGNPPFEWLGDESGYKSSMAALEVWKAMGVEDRFGYEFSGGHDHCQAAPSQNDAATAFIDKFLRDNNADTDIRVVPAQNGFDLDFESSIDWSTPEINFNPNGPVVTITAPSADSDIIVSNEVQVEVDVTDNDENVTLVELFINDEKIEEDATAPYVFSWTPDTPGDVTINVVATDAEDNTGAASVDVTVRVPQGPYNGTPLPIPGTIQLEEYDVGGNGFAYYDDSPGSETGVDFRTDEDVDIEECTDDGGGYNIGWATSGEWLEYTVQIENAGTYAIELRVACDGDGRTVGLSMDEEVIAGDITMPNTGGWQAWETVMVNGVELNAGEQVMRLTIGAEDYINLNYIAFEGVITNVPDREKSTMSLYPNPFTAALNIQQAGDFHYRIHNANGTLINSGKGHGNAIIGQHIDPGFYMLTVEHGKAIDMHKIVKR